MTDQQPTINEVFGIIQVINEEVFYDEPTYQKVIAGEYTKFHIPNIEHKLNITDLKVFLYSTKRGGIFAFFNSKGIFLDPDVIEDEFKLYFEIQNFKEIPENKRLNKEQLITIDSRLKSWEKRGQPYWKIDEKMVNELLKHIQN